MGRNCDGVEIHCHRYVTVFLLMGSASDYETLQVLSAVSKVHKALRVPAQTTGYISATKEDIDIFGFSIRLHLIIKLLDFFKHFY